MKSIIHRITPKDKRTLALSYEKDTLNALNKIINMMIGNAANHSLASPDWETSKHLQGQAFSLRELKKLLKDIYDADQKS